jgi:hypothetical protein
MTFAATIAKHDRQWRSAPVRGLTALWSAPVAKATQGDVRLAKPTRGFAEAPQPFGGRMLPAGLAERQPEHICSLSYAVNSLPGEGSGEM